MEIAADRLHPNTGAQTCQLGQRPSLRSDGAVECFERPDTQADTLYACATGMEFYECEAEGACEGGSSLPHPVEYVDPVDTWLPNRRRLAEGAEAATANSTCRNGHVGVLCAQCSPGFVMNKQRLCEECPESTMMVYVAGAALLVGVVALYSYVDGGSSSGDADLEEDNAPWCACCRVGCCKPQATAKTKKRTAKKKLSRTPSLMAYAKALVSGIIEQPDKFMLLVSFVQVRPCVLAG